MRWQEGFRRYVLSGHEVATESGKQGVLEALATCVRYGDVATARVGYGKEEAEKEGARAPISAFFFYNFFSTLLSTLTVETAGYCLTIWSLTRCVWQG